jgi:hypothetical protein
MERFHRAPNRVMSDGPRERNKLELAAALAQDISISAWARANNVAKQTAQRWAHEPEETRAQQRCGGTKGAGALTRFCPF